MTNPTKTDRKVTIGSYIALAFAIVFFSGLMQSNEWYGVLDFTTLNGSFGKVAYDVSETADGIQAATTSLRGKGGSGARDGFIFALTLIPTVMFALGMINVLEHYGALDAARKLLTPLLRPLMGIPGNSGLALIASLQSTDAGAAMTRQLKDEGHLTKRETDVFTMFQFTAGAAIVNFFSSGAVLFTLTAMDGSLAVTSSIGLAVAVMFIFKFVGANLFRIYLNITEGKEDKPKSDKEQKTGRGSSIMSEVKAKKPMVTDIFVEGAKKGWVIATTSTVPNVLMAFVIIKALQITGVLDLMGSVFAPIMAVFGLPGEAAAVLIGAWMSMGGAVGVVITLFDQGILNGNHIAILAPAIYLMGSQVQYMGRIMGPIGTEGRYIPVMIATSVLNAFGAMFLMNIIL